MHRSRIALTLTAVGMLMILSSCAAGPNTLAGGDGQAAGFWLGLWQGLIIPITFIVSLFNSQVSIYEEHSFKGLAMAAETGDFRLYERPFEVDMFPTRSPDRWV